MPGRSRSRGALLGVMAASLVVLLFGTMGSSQAEEPAPGPAKAEAKRRERAWSTDYQTWLRALHERVQRWRRGGRFDEISAAAEEALARFPDEQAVTLVVEVAGKINSSNAELSEGPDRWGLNAWCVDLSLRALEKLPRPPRVRDHAALLLGIHWVRTPSRKDPTAIVTPADRHRILAAVVGFVRRCHDDLDPLWDPRTPQDMYPPVRPSDPKWMAGLGEKGPADEGEFLRFEEAWYARLLTRQDQGDLRQVRKDTNLAALLAVLARVPAPAPEADRDLEAAAQRVPELDLVRLVDVQRRSQQRMWEETTNGVQLRLSREVGGSWQNHGNVGQGLPVVLTAFNFTKVPQVVPLGLARAALLYGDGPSDESVLPPRRQGRAEDLVVIEPGGHASLSLPLSLPRDGLARVLVVLQNDQPSLGGKDLVWTGAQRFVELVDVSASGEGARIHLRGLQQTASRAKIPVPEEAEDVARMVERLSEEWSDDRSVEVLRALAAESKDATVVRAALDRLIAAVGRGYGASARFAFQAVAQDPERGFEQRVRAVEGLALFLAARRQASFTAGEAVRVVVDEPSDARVVADVRARLEALLNDSNHAVGAAARSALGR